MPGTGKWQKILKTKYVVPMGIQIIDEGYQGLDPTSVKVRQQWKLSNMVRRRYILKNS